MMKIIKAAMAMVAVGVLSSCGGQSSASRTVGPEGGVVSTQSGLSVDLPAGALDKQTEITVRETEVNGERHIELEPRGVELHGRATVSVGEDVPGELEAEASERHQPLEVRHEDHRARLEIERLEPIIVRHRGDDGAHDVGDDHGRDGVDGGDDRGRDAVDGGDDHGLGGLDGGDDHGRDADAGTGTPTGAACVTDDTCACGASCISGQCVAEPACTTSADCAAGVSCRPATRHGAACGALVCHP